MCADVSTFALRNSPYFVISHQFGPIGLRVFVFIICHFTSLMAESG